MTSFISWFRSIVGQPVWNLDIEDKKDAVNAEHVDAVKAQIEKINTAYHEEITALTTQLAQDISPVLEKRGWSLVSGMGTWFISSRRGESFFEDNEDEDYIQIKELLSLPLPYGTDIGLMMPDIKMVQTEATSLAEKIESEWEHKTVDGEGRAELAEDLIKLYDMAGSKSADSQIKELFEEVLDIEIEKTFDGPPQEEIKRIEESCPDTPSRIKWMADNYWGSMIYVTECII